MTKQGKRTSVVPPAEPDQNETVQGSHHLLLMLPTVLWLKSKMGLFRTLEVQITLLHQVGLWTPLLPRGYWIDISVLKCNRCSEGDSPAFFPHTRILMFMIDTTSIAQYNIWWCCFQPLCSKPLEEPSGGSERTECFIILYYYIYFYYFNIILFIFLVLS